MKRLSVGIASMLLLGAAGAQAHAHLRASNPAEGASVAETLTTVSLTFSEAARITTVSLKKDQQPTQALQAPDGVAAKILSVALPKLAAGNYTLSFRVVSEDNHLMSGELHFKVEPKN